MWEFTKYRFAGQETMSKKTIMVRINKESDEALNEIQNKYITKFGFAPHRYDLIEKAIMTLYKIELKSQKQDKKQ